MKSSPQIPDELVRMLRDAQRVALLTGAGISAESGVPTFRDAQTGLWARYRAEELATPAAFQRNPKLVWEWYEWRRELIAAAAPNPGHFALVEMEKRVPIFTLITQNVDGLHQEAGSQSVVELHGNIRRTKCSAEDKIVSIWDETGDVPPRCPDCGALLRPDVVWFGENLPQSELHQAMKASNLCALFFSIGTSAFVQPAASLPVLAHDSGAVVAEINPDRTPLTPIADYILQGPAGSVLPALVERVWGS